MEPTLPWSEQMRQLAQWPVHRGAVAGSAPRMPASTTTTLRIGVGFGCLSVGGLGIATTVYLLTRGLPSISSPVMDERSVPDAAGAVAYSPCGRGRPSLTSLGTRRWTSTSSSSVPGSALFETACRIASGGSAGLR
jgi:hypothetical protein